VAGLVAHHMALAVLSLPAVTNSLFESAIA
jgi:hypothetical protein